MLTFLKYGLKNGLNFLITNLSSLELTNSNKLQCTAVTWMKYCRYGVKLYSINQCIMEWMHHVAIQKVKIKSARKVSQLLTKEIKTIKIIKFTFDIHVYRY